MLQTSNPINFPCFFLVKLVRPAKYDNTYITMQFVHYLVFMCDGGNDGDGGGGGGWICRM